MKGGRQFHAGTRVCWRARCPILRSGLRPWFHFGQRVCRKGPIGAVSRQMPFTRDSTGRLWDQAWISLSPLELGPLLHQCLELAFGAHVLLAEVLNLGAVGWGIGEASTEGGELVFKGSDPGF